MTFIIQNIVLGYLRHCLGSLEYFCHQKCRKNAKKCSLELTLKFDFTHQKMVKHQGGGSTRTRLVLGQGGEILCNCFVNCETDLCCPTLQGGGEVTAFMCLSTLTYQGGGSARAKCPQKCPKTPLSPSGTYSANGREWP